MRSVWIVLALLSLPVVAGAQGVDKYPAGTPVPVVRPYTEGGTLPVPHRSIGSVGVGERAPDFELESASGGKRHLSDWRGSWVALWFGSRAPSIAAADTLARAVAPDGVAVLMIAAERSGMLRGWLDRNPGAMVTLLSDAMRDIACEYGAFDATRGHSTPGFVLVDADGVVRVAVVGVALGADDARRMVQIAKTSL
ncbi:MAG: redoxin domain-containing protein [Candidatus Eisenbacteria bacterium]|uniref:Redoxin domain-containing protein n=1 Tax=Eiseniibacteriota bacterium TaxID=2212470 RepID=A0A933WAM2_UNCEI|nr:redoxin domain-containing protein [Candidatus Eisenbacteria bacterium]